MASSQGRLKTSTTIYLEPEQMRRLAALNASTRVPMAVFVREGVDMVLERHAPIVRPQVAEVRHEPKVPADATRAG